MTAARHKQAPGRDRAPATTTTTGPTTTMTNTTTTNSAAAAGTITPAIRNRVTEVISAGLVSGLGRPVPGELCLEAAICLALGEGHGDRPSCVAAPDRAFAIALQDRFPGTAAERAELFLPLGLAQLGTAGTDRMPWVRRVVEGTIRKVLPFGLRRAAGMQPDSAAQHKDALLGAADLCEREGTIEAARSARTVARAAYAYAAAAYAAYAADAADAARAAADAADAADAAAYAAYAADAARAAASRREAITLAVGVALEAYRVEGRE